ncbi:MAG TPA: DUF4340 domain-containing protein [Anaerolinea sp.]|nr:DUF4340 domain-containing protein [Anaerolinea sp.]
MIRRSTWVVFIVFLVIAAAGIFLLRSPASPLPATAAETPSATPAPLVIQGWDAAQVTDIQYVSAAGEQQHLARTPDSLWTDMVKQSPVAIGQVEELLSELLTMRVLTSMPTDYSLDALALANPTQKISIGRQDGTSVELWIGNVTPTGNGYYVRVNNNAPVVVSKYALDAVTQLFTDTQATATPLPSPLPEVTATP